MFRYRFHYKTKREVIDALRNGVKTQHFRAKIRYPEGFEHSEKITIEMINPADFRSEWDYGVRATRDMYDDLTDELLDLRDKVDEVLSEITLWMVERNFYRKLNRRAS